MPSLLMECQFAGRNSTRRRTTLENSLSISLKLNIFLLYDPAIVLLGIYPNQLKSYAHTKTCTQMFIAALFIVAKSWK